MHLFKLNILLTGVLLVLSTSCKEEKSADLLTTPTTIAEERGINLANLLGTWVDASNNEKSFSLYNDGSVDQEYMKELELKDWTLEETDLVFARKNSKGEQTEMNQERYKIINLTEQELTLEKEGDTIVFKKK
ncbi:MAG: lipocalin family protein [Weeksellaceae bacterium]